MNKHTPGPWFWAKARTLQHLENSEGGVSGVEMPIPKQRFNGDHEASVKEQNEANAHLISAAPDLLEASEIGLERLMMNNLDGEETEFINKIQAAIAKAKGE